MPVTEISSSPLEQKSVPCNTICCATYSFSVRVMSLQFILSKIKCYQRGDFNDAPRFPYFLALNWKIKRSLIYNTSVRSCPSQHCSSHDNSFIMVAEFS